MSSDAQQPLPTATASPDSDPPAYSSERGRAAFRALEQRLSSMPPPPPRGGVDTEDAALLALAVVRRVRAPELYRRFALLPDELFKLSNIDLLEQAAWATWFLHKEAERVRSGSEAKLPTALLEEVNAVEARMQACCEYYFGDDPELGPEVARLRSGTGYRDLAADLLGYADIYHQRHDVVSQDRKHYRATDAADAVRLAERILEIIGEALGPDGQTAVSLLARAFELLRTVYKDVSETGLWILRDEPEREKRFPSLYSTTRSRAARTRRRGEEEPSGQG